MRKWNYVVIGGHRHVRLSESENNRCDWITSQAKRSWKDFLEVWTWFEIKLDWREIWKKGLESLKAIWRVPRWFKSFERIVENFEGYECLFWNSLKVRHRVEIKKWRGKIKKIENCQRKFWETSEKILRNVKENFEKCKDWFFRNVKRNFKACQRKFWKMSKTLFQKCQRKFWKMLKILFQKCQRKF